jgi:hypothetical protein
MQDRSYSRVSPRSDDRSTSRARTAPAPRWGGPAATARRARQHGHSSSWQTDAAHGTSLGRAARRGLALAAPGLLPGPYGVADAADAPAAVGYDGLEGHRHVPLPQEDAG